MSIDWRSEEGHCSICGRLLMGWRLCPVCDTTEVTDE